MAKKKKNTKKTKTNKKKQAKTTPKKKKSYKKNRHKGRRGAELDLNTVEAMFKMYVLDAPLSEIAKIGEVSRQHIYVIAENHNWDKRKERIMKKLRNRFDKEIENYAWANKKERAKFLEERFQVIKLQQQAAINNIYKNHSEDPLSVGKLESIKDIERLYSLFHTELNDGVTKSEQVHSGSINVGPGVTVGEEDEKRKRALKVISGGKTE